MELKFYVKFLTLLDFHQIEFFIETRFSKNKGILLDSFKIRAFCYIFWAKWAFDLQSCNIDCKSKYNYNHSIIVKFNNSKCCSIFNNNYIY